MLEDIVRTGVVLASFVPALAFALAALGALLRDPESLHKRVARQLRRAGFEYIARPRLAGAAAFREKGGADKASEAWQFAIRTPAGPVLLVFPRRPLAGDLVAQDATTGALTLRSPVSSEASLKSNDASSARAELRAAGLRDVRTVTLLPGRGRILTQDPVDVVNGPGAVVPYLRDLARRDAAGGNAGAAWDRLSNRVVSGRAMKDGVVSRIAHAGKSAAAAAACATVAVALWQMHAF